MRFSSTGIGRVLDASAEGMPFESPRTAWRPRRAGSNPFTRGRALRRPGDAMRRQAGVKLGNNSMTALKALLVSSVLLAAGLKPMLATEMLQPVAMEDLDQFIGSTVFGQARAPLGVVSKA